MPTLEEKMNEYGKQSTLASSLHVAIEEYIKKGGKLDVSEFKKKVWDSFSNNLEKFDSLNYTLSFRG